MTFYIYIMTLAVKEELAHSGQQLLYLKKKKRRTKMRVAQALEQIINL